MTELEILQSRKSVRGYSLSPISDSMSRTLRSEATFINSHEAGLSFRPVFGNGDPFKGATRSYGMFKGVENYLVAVVDPSFPHTYERAGYYGEQWVIEAVKLGLGTCFVGVTFSASQIDTMVEVYEKIPFVITFGHGDDSRTPLTAKIAMAVAHRKRRSPRFFFDGDDNEYVAAMHAIPWLGTALEAVACAPSALNKQPVRLKSVRLKEGWTVAAHTLNPKTDAIELGIAKFNVAYAVKGVWDWGENGLFFPE